MVYLCQRCGYTTEHTGRFSQHINKIYTCKPIIEDINITEIRDIFVKNKEELNKTIIKNKNKKKYFCGRCGYTTNSKKYILGHINRKKICNADISNISMETVLIQNNITEDSNQVSSVSNMMLNIFNQDIFNNTDNYNNIIEENTINIHIIEKDVYNALDISGINCLIQKDLQKNQYESNDNINKLDEIYQNLLKENNITEEDNIDSSDDSNENIIHFDTENAEEYINDNDNYHTNTTFTTSFTDSNKQIDDFDMYMKEALENSNNINVVNKINNISVHCHGINLDLINMNDYSIFSNLEPGKYILVMDEKKNQFDTELIIKLDNK